MTIPTHLADEGGRSVQRCTFAIADDDEGVRKALADLLTHRFTLIAAVADGRQLIDAAMLLEPDLLLIDLNMPVLGGLQTLEVLQTVKVRSKAIVVSACPDWVYVRRALQLGALAYVLKGLAAEDLPHAMTSVLLGKTFLSAGIMRPDRRRGSIPS